MNRIRIVLLLTLLSLPGQLGAQVTESKGQGAGLVRTEKRVGPFAFGANEIMVVLDQVSSSVTGGWVDTTVAGLRLVDGQGRVHFEEEYYVYVTDDGELGSEHEVYPSVIEFSGGRLFSLAEAFFPSAPQSGATWRLFAWRDGSLAPISGPIDGYGQFVDLPKDSSSWGRHMWNSRSMLANRTSASRSMFSSCACRSV